MIYTWQDYQRDHPSNESFISKYYHFQRVRITLHQLWATVFQRKFYSPRPIESCLDIGTYRGFYAYFLAQQDVNITVLAVDTHFPKYIAEQDNIHYILANALDVLDVGKFDLILLLEVYEHLPLVHREMMLRKIAKSLTKGGVLIFSAPNRVSFYRGLGFLKQWIQKKRGKLEKIDDHFRIPWVHYNQALRKYFDLLKWTTTGFLPLPPRKISDHFTAVLEGLDRRFQRRFRGLGANYFAIARKKEVGI